MAMVETNVRKVIERLKADGWTNIGGALLEAIDAAAKERGLSRSAFLASAAREKIMAGA